MGSIDKIIRILVAVIIAALYFTNQISGTLAIILGILAVVFAATSLIGFCPLYLPFGISTRKKIIEIRHKSKNRLFKKMKTKVTIIDVRTPAEFMSGHVAESINIPLQEITQRLDEIKNMQQPIVLCCASGGRSGQATAFLRGHGIECENGGSWLDVHYAFQPN